MLYFILSLIPLFIYIIMESKRSLHMLQQNWYNLDQRYLKWIMSNRYKEFVNADVCFVIFIIALFIEPIVAYILFIVFYLVVIYFYKRRMSKEQVKIPLKVTARMKRLIVTTSILYLVPVLSILLTFDESLLAYYYLILGGLAYINNFVVMTSEFINIPVEKYVFNGFKRKATKKLKSINGLEVIGITGSYGKTSSKNILNDVLNVRFNAFKTPKNFNTPIGLIISVNNYLDKFTDLFIAEMGAFKIGEIQELCDLVHPKYGILTKVGTAHLESFGSQENIRIGKFELIESLPHDGIGILNGDDPLQTSYELKNDCKIVWVGIDNENVDVRATDIKLSHLGTTFNVIFKGDDNKYEFNTRLLGTHNIYNILQSIALGKELGLSIKELQAGVNRVNAIEHRLELKKMGDVNIIDDAYNSNPVGSKMALEVLDLMPGKKIVVTPGMIELGDKQYELNMKFGEYIADVADDVILVGKEQTKPLYDGLMHKDYSKKHIHILNDVKDAFPLINELKNKDTYVLLENDLPDIFNEK